MTPIDFTRRTGRGAVHPSLREHAAREGFPFQPRPVHLVGAGASFGEGLAPVPTHRWTNDPDGEAYCLDCWQTWRIDADGIPCDTEREACSVCGRASTIMEFDNWPVCTAHFGWRRRNA